MITAAQALTDWTAPSMSPWINFMKDISLKDDKQANG